MLSFELKKYTIIRKYSFRIRLIHADLFSVD